MREYGAHTGLRAESVSCHGHHLAEAPLQDRSPKGKGPFCWYSKENTSHVKVLQSSGKISFILNFTEDQISLLKSKSHF